MIGCLILQKQNFIRDTNIPFVLSYHSLCMDDCYYLCPFSLLSMNIWLVWFFGRGVCYGVFYYFVAISSDFSGIFFCLTVSL